jgi:hypothetical protein
VFSVAIVSAAVLPQKVGDWHAAFCSLEHADNLRLAEFRLPHDRSG